VLEYLIPRSATGFAALILKCIDSTYVEQG